MTDIFEDVIPETVIDDSAAKKRARESARDRKRAQRQREAEQKASQAHTAAKTNHEYWEQSRRTLTKEKRELYEERQDHMMMLHGVMKYYVDGTVPSWGAPDKATADYSFPESEPLDSIIQEVRSDVARNGTLDWSLCTVDCIFRTPQEDRKRFYSSYERGATEAFIEFGWWLAMDTALYLAFHEKFISKPTTTYTPECITDGCHNPQGKAEKHFCDDCAGQREALRIKDRSKPRMIIDKESYFAPASATFGEEGEWK